MASGKFIVFEGGEGSGKTHHVDMSKQYFEEKGNTVLMTHEPGGSTLGGKIRSLILDKSDKPTTRAELFLFLADRAHHVERVIEPALKNDSVVLCDRFSGSTLAYQIGARGLKESNTIINMDEYSRNGLEPDIVIYLDVEPELGVARKSKQLQSEMTSFDEAGLDFHIKVRDYFRTLTVENDNWHRFDANRSLSEVQIEINKLFDSL